MRKPILLLHSDRVTERGDSTNARNYSRTLSTEFGIETMITFPKEARNNPAVIAQLDSMGLNLFAYDSFSQLQNYAQNVGVTHAYFMNDGKYTGQWIPGAKKLTHAVFRNYQPHGDVYAYCTRWLRDTATSWKEEMFRLLAGQSFRSPAERQRIEDAKAEMRSPYQISLHKTPDWVPHCIMPEPGDGLEFRKRFSIPTFAPVVGRIGGNDQFDDPAAHRAVASLLESNPEIVFCFVNTQKFIEHPRAIFIPGVTELEKWGFYSACDVLLNGRLMGETFGFTIVEPLSLGKPVVAPALARNPGMDAHHIELLKGMDLTYKNHTELSQIILRELSAPTAGTILRERVAQFEPSVVAQRFKQVFLDGL